VKKKSYSTTSEGRSHLREGITSSAIKKDKLLLTNPHSAGRMDTKATSVRGEAVQIKLIENERLAHSTGSGGPNNWKNIKKQLH